MLILEENWINASTASINLFVPERAEEHEEGFMALFSGDDCAFRNYYINLETWRGYIYDDDFGTEEFEAVSKDTQRTDSFQSKIKNSQMAILRHL